MAALSRRQLHRPAFRHTGEMEGCAAPYEGLARAAAGGNGAGRTLCCRGGMMERGGNAAPFIFVMSCEKSSPSAPSIGRGREYVHVVLGPQRMMAAPSRQIATPSISHLSGRISSAAHSQIGRAHV